jgi:signal transduction histidine kinase
VETDPHRIRQVLQNLVTNALKFCKDDGFGEVLVSVIVKKTNPNMYEFSVTDNGIGMSRSGRYI